MESPKFDVKIEVKDAGGGDDGGSGSSEGREGKDDDETSSKSSSQMQGLLEEFTKIYTDRLHRVEKTTSDPQDPQYLKNKVTVLESWVHDLGDQNEVLVATVEELEREAGDRVALLEDRLSKMAATTRDSCLSLRDHQMQVSSLVADKVGLERETEMLEEKVLGLERKSITLKEENNSLQNDLNNLVQVITRARLTGQWEADNLTFSCLTPEQVFGPVLSSSRRSSQSLKDSQRDYIHSMFEDHMRKDCSSSRSSFSNLQDGDGSMYSGRGSDKDMVIMRLRSDLRCLQTTHEETNQQLLDRDKQIADLQTQLTELYHELAETQTEVNNVNTALQEVRHRTRQENVEITRKKEVVRQALSKQSREDSKRGSCTSLCDLESVLTGENNIESQLSENIDVLAGRLAELEDECQGLRDQYASLKDSHAVCAPTITMLQDQLARSQQSQVELRTVLTEEVAERHDQLVALGEKLKDEEQKHHETRMQVHLKNEVIKDLRKHLREIRERQPECKSDIMHLEAAVQTTVKDSKARETQTDPTTSDNKNLNSMKGAVINGFHASSTAHPAQVSRLENELAEKNILLKELQTHLATSRQELHLKDETLSKLEKKLDSVRREGGESDDRMQYLMGQLTNLQLEVGRTHGQAEQFRRQVENKNQLIQKIEQENISLSQQLNDKSLSLEKFQRDMLSISTDLEKRKNEVSEQKVTISSLQEALVSSKRMCDDLRSRLDSDVASRGNDVRRLSRDLEEAQSLHHHTFTQLVEAGTRVEVLQEENKILTRRVTTIQEEAEAWRNKEEEAAKETTQAQKECERAKRDRDQLQRQFQDSERRRNDLLTSLQLLQVQVQTLEEEVTTSSDARLDAERRASETQRENLCLHDRLCVQETSGSVERLGRQLEETVSILTSARQEAASRQEQLRKSQLECERLREAITYEKQLTSSLHDQVESLVGEAGELHGKLGEHQHDVRRLTRDITQKERQMSTLQGQVEGLRNQLKGIEEVLAGRTKEVEVLTESLAKETQALQDSRNRLTQARREVARTEEREATCRRELQDAHDKIICLEHHARMQEGEHEAEVATLVERLTAQHEASVRRLEESFLCSGDLRPDLQVVAGLEEELAETVARLGRREVQLRELERERDALSRNLQHEVGRREAEATMHQDQLARLNQETALLRSRLEGVREEAVTWQRQCEDLEQREDLTRDPNAFNDHLVSTLHQAESLRAALATARAEARAADEERGMAHDQVLSLIRECNQLEDQIEGLNKDKARMEEEVASLKEELNMTRNSSACTTPVKFHTMAAATPTLTSTPSHSEKSEIIVKEEITQLRKEVQKLRNQLQEARDRTHQIESGQGARQDSSSEEEVMEAWKEVRELRKKLLEKEAESRLTSLNVTTLQKSLEQQQKEISVLEESLQQAQTEAHKAEVEAEELRAKVDTLSHTPATPTIDTTQLDNLHDELSKLKGELAAKDEELKQAYDRGTREEGRLRDAQEEVARLIKARDEALRKVMSLESSLGESEAVMAGARVVERVWGSQLHHVEEEMARLECENNQLKECNLDLHHQGSASQQELEQLQSQYRAKESDFQELQQARDLLANDAQVLVAAVKQWLHEQKSTNMKMAAKLQQTNKQVMLVNTEKMFLAERNTSLQRHNHELSLQLHHLTTRLGLPPTPSPSERQGKVGGVLVGGMTSPRVLSPVMGVTTPNATSPRHEYKMEDGFSTCSSGSSSSSGCHIPGPDLPGSFHLDRLAALADSLLATSRNVGRASRTDCCSGSGNGKVASATSLTDLTSITNMGHFRSGLGHTRRASSSTGNLTSLHSSPSSRLPSYRTNDLGGLITSLGSSAKAHGRTGEKEIILGAPVKERRRSAHQLFLTDSIEETEEETNAGHSNDSNINSNNQTMNYSSTKASHNPTMNYRSIKTCNSSTMTSHDHIKPCTEVKESRQIKSSFCSHTCTATQTCDSLRATPLHESSV